MTPRHGPTAQPTISAARILSLAIAGGAVLLAGVAIPIVSDRFVESRRAAAEELAATAREHVQRHAMAPCPPGHIAKDARLLRRLGVDPGKVRFAAVVLPMVEPEYAVAVDGDDPGHTLRVVRLRQSFFILPDAPESHAAATGSSSQPMIRRQLLDPALVDRLEREWLATVTQVHPKVPTGWGGARPVEVTYAFLTPQGCAQVSGPEPGTRRGQMAELVERLARGDDGTTIAQALDALVHAPPPEGGLVSIR